MLRYRVAAMVWMFMFLGAAFNGRLGNSVAELAWAALALASSYVAATTLNDVADRDIDRVNHPRDSGRPLVSGEACERDLLLLHVVASAMALTAAVPLGLAGVGLVAGSLVIGHVYSARPFVLSHRTYLAPSSLGVAYVLVPYGLGVAAVGSVPDGGDVVFCAGLFALFVTRINLKDFRDRRGDALYGRPTLLLRFGKDATCGVSLITLLVGNVFLVVALDPPLAVAAILELFVLAIAWMLRSLRTAAEGRAEQVAIGIGAKMGNGLLLTALGWLLLAGSGAPTRDRILFLGVLAGAFAVSFAKLVQSPERAVLGYKG
jgi:4-hydroxybenzoate polyprenyltransferase